MSEPGLPPTEQSAKSAGHWLPIVILIAGGMALAISSCFGLVLSLQSKSWLAEAAAIGLIGGGAAFFAGILWAVVAFIRRLMKGKSR